MTHLEATVQTVTNWATLGLYKGLTPEQLRGEFLALLMGIKNAESMPKRKRTVKPPEKPEETAKPVHVDMTEENPWD